MWRIRPRSITKAHSDTTRFDRLGESTLCVQSELKRRLAAGFEGLPNVRTAYLARLIRSSAPSVAVCVRTELGDDRCVRRIASDDFAGLPNPEPIAILFISEAEEQQLRRMCTPFFVGRTETMR